MKKLRYVADSRVPLREVELASLREAGKILTKALDLLVGELRPGVRGSELDGYAQEYIEKNGGEPAFKNHKAGSSVYPATLCLCVDDVVLHGIPSKDLIGYGQVVSLDLGVRVDGMYADAARTVYLEPLANPDLRVRALVQTTARALKSGVRAAKQYGNSEAVSRAIYKALVPAGFFPTAEAGGHGVGRKLHETPFIANVPNVALPVSFTPGLAYAIEPVALTRNAPLKLDADGWTLRAPTGVVGAHFEQTLFFLGDSWEVIAQ